MHTTASPAPASSRSLRPGLVAGALVHKLHPCQHLVCGGGMVQQVDIGKADGVGAQHIHRLEVKEHGLTTYQHHELVRVSELLDRDRLGPDDEGHCKGLITAYAEYDRAIADWRDALLRIFDALAAQADLMP